MVLMAQAMALVLPCESLLQMEFESDRPNRDPERILVDLVLLSVVSWSEPLIDSWSRGRLATSNGLNCGVEYCVVLFELGITPVVEVGYNLDGKVPALDLVLKPPRFGARC